MKISEAKQEVIEFLPQRHLIQLRGYIMLVMGIFVAFCSIVAPDIVIMSFKNAWLPVASMIILLVGVVEIIDTYISRKSSRFFSNLQFAILDTTIGWMLLFSMSYPANQVAILIAAFLIIKGLFRLIGAYVSRLSNSKAPFIGGGVSIIIGFLIWVKWPGDISSALLSFGLSAEVALRGWALVKFAQWLSELEEG